MCFHVLASRRGRRWRTCTPQKLRPPASATWTQCRPRRCAALKLQTGLQAVLPPKCRRRCSQKGAAFTSPLAVERFRSLTTRPAYQTTHTLPTTSPPLFPGRALAGVEHGGARGAARLRRCAPPPAAGHAGGMALGCLRCCGMHPRAAAPPSVGSVLLLLLDPMLPPTARIPRTTGLAWFCARARRRKPPRVRSALFPAALGCLPLQVQGALAARKSPEFREQDEKLREARAAAQGAQLQQLLPMAVTANA